MLIRELRAQGWRNLEPLDFTPGPRVNVLHGDNGQGKTNLIEAVYYLATLRSFRTSHADELVRGGAPSWLGGRSSRRASSTAGSTARWRSGSAPTAGR